MIHHLRRLFGIAVWLSAAAGIALGSAGLAGGLDHPAGAGGRGELTLAGDAAIEPGLRGATSAMAKLAEDVGSISDLGREALGALVARETDALQAAIDAGAEKIAVVQADAAALRATLTSLPGTGPGETGRISTEVLARRAALLAALPSVDELDESWSRLVSGAVPATALTDHLLGHDQLAAKAVEYGSAGKYGLALVQLRKATDELDAARAVRDRLAKTVDTGTLDEWIGRNVAYDTAVKALWQELLRSKGKITDVARAAAKAVDQARLALPPDARALAVILGDVARGGLNQAVVEVEEVRGPLVDAVQAATPVQPVTANPGGSGGSGAAEDAASAAP